MDKIENEISDTCPQHEVNWEAISLNEKFVVEKPPPTLSPDRKQPKAYRVVELPSKDLETPDGLVNYGGLKNAFESFLRVASSSIDPFYFENFHYFYHERGLLNSFIVLQFPRILNMYLFTENHYLISKHGITHYITEIRLGDLIPAGIRVAAALKFPISKDVKTFSIKFDFLKIDCVTYEDPQGNPQSAIITIKRIQGYRKITYDTGYTVQWYTDNPKAVPLPFICRNMRKMTLGYWSSTIQMPPKDFLLARNSSKADVEVNPGPCCLFKPAYHVAMCICSGCVMFYNVHNVISFEQMDAFMPQCIKDISAGLTSGPTEIKTSVDDLTRAFNNMPSQFEEILSKFSAKGHKHYKTTGNYLLVTLCMAALIDYGVNNRKHQGKLVLAIAGVAAVTHSMEIANFVTEMLAKFDSKPIEMFSCEQMWVGTGDFDLPKILRDILSKILSFIDVPQVRLLKDYTHFIVNFSRIREGLSSILTWIFESIDYLCEKLSGYRVIPSSWYKNTVQERNIRNFLASFEKFTDDVKKGKVMIDITTFSVLQDFEGMCNSLRLNADRNSGAIVVLDSILRDIKALKHKFAGVMIEFTRPEPAAILFRSAPGQFKSSIAGDLCLRLANYENTPSADPRNYLEPINIHKSGKAIERSDASKVYARQIVNEYMDGYCGQPVFFYDDFGQTRDIAGMALSEFREFIGIKNTVPFHCHMAGVDDKKDTYFTSAFIVATTNAKQFSVESIIDPAALDRRWDLDVILCLKPQYCRNPTSDLFTRVCDRNKFTVNSDGKLDITTDMFDFFITKADGSQESVSYEELFKRLIMAREKYKAVYESKQDLRKPQVKRAALKILSDFDLTADDGDIIAYEKVVDVGFVGVNKEYLDKHPELYPFYRKVRSYMGVEPMDFQKNLKQFLLDNGVDILERILVVGPDYSDIIVSFCESVPIYPLMYELPSRTLLDSVICSYKEQMVIAKKWLSEYGPIIGLASLCTSIYALYNHFTTEERAEEQSSSKAHLKPGGKYRSLSEIANEHVPLKAQAHLEKDQGSIDEANSIVQKNMAAMIVNGQHRGYVLFVGGTLIVLPSHYINMFDMWVRDPEAKGITLDTPMYLKPCHPTADDHTGYVISIKDFLSGHLLNEDLAKRELAFINLPDHIPPKRNIVNKFRSSKQLRDKYNSVLLAKGQKGNVKYSGTVFMFANNAFRQKAHTLRQSDGGLKEIINVIVSSMPTTDGDCGAVLLEINAKMPKKILGLHTAGNSDIGTAVAAPLFIEDVEWAFGVCETIQSSIANKAEDLGTILDDRYIVEQMAKPVDKVTRSEIVRSSMFGLFQEPTHFPSILRPVMRDNVMIDPVIKSLSKYNCNSGIYVPPYVLKQAIDSEIDFYFNVSHFDIERRKLTNDEAVIGIEFSTDFSPLSRRTSPGYPYCFEKEGMKGKTSWLGVDGEYHLTSPKWQKFLQEVSIMEDQLAENIIPEFIFVDNLKDELRKKKKIDEVSTRNFSAAPMSLVFLFRKYFGTFINWFHANRLDNGSAIGINPHSNEWHMLTIMLHGKSNRINAGDFKGFDTAHAPQLSSGLLAIPLKFYEKYSNPRDFSIRRTLWTTLLTTHHLFEDKVVRWDSGLVSGHVLTAIINSMYNRLVHKLSFYYLTNKSLVDFWTFNKEVCLITFGDDSLMSCTKDYEDKFNENTIGEAMKRFGLIYTPENKESFNVDPRDIEDVTFLKRSFRFERRIGKYVDPLDLGRLKETLNWTKRNNGLEILQDKCLTFVRELSLHGKSVFDSYIGKLNDKYHEVFGEYLPKTNFEVCLTDALNSVLDFEISNCQMNSMMIQETNNTHVVALDDKTEVIHPANVTQTLEVVDTPRIQDKVDLVIRDPIWINGTEIGVTGGRGPVKLKFQMDSTLVQADLDKPTDVVQEDDGTVITWAPPHAVINNDFESDHSGGDPFSTLRKALNRLTVTVSGTLASTDTATTFPTYDWSNNLYSDAMISSKLKGVYSIRADLIVHIDINANPMQQGLYRLYFCYTGGANGGLQYETAWELMHRYSKIQVSQCLGAWVNIGCDTRVSFKIPWRSCANAYVINYTNPRISSPGVVHLYPFTAINSTSGSTTVPYTIWYEYTNVSFGVGVYNQMARKSKVDLVEQEAQSAKPSDYLIATSNAAKAFAQIPLLSTVATPLWWFAETGAKVAKFLGFSKPLVIDAPRRVVRTMIPYCNVADAASAAAPMTIVTNAHVGLDGGYMGSELDEMAISFVSQISSWFNSGTWSTAATSGTELWSLELNPTDYYTTTSDAGVFITSYVPIAWLNNHMQYWRGSIKYTFTLAKTKFHSGRLLASVVYKDSISSTIPAYTMPSSSYVPKTIIDIREVDEFEITVPYVSTHPWAISSIGKLYIHVLDPLVAPAVVPSSVVIHGSIRGGPDFAVCGTPKTTLDGVTEAFVVPSAYQMNSECIHEDVTIGTTKVIDKSAEARKATLGEPILSLRQLVKRLRPVMPDNLISAGNIVNIRPSACGYGKSSGGIVSISSNSMSYDFFAQLNAIYALRRGGLRIAFLPSKGNVGVYVATVISSVAATPPSKVYNAVAGTINTMLLAGSLSPQHSFDISNPHSEMQFPQSSATTNVCCAANCVSSLVTNTELGADHLELFTSTPTGSTLTSVMMRGGSDDCCFGCFVSIPPMYNYSTPT